MMNNGYSTPFSKSFQLYHGGQLLWWTNPEFSQKLTDHSEVTYKYFVS